MTQFETKNGRGLREKLEEVGLRLVRAYTYNTPLRKGKHRLYMAALDLCRTRPEPIRVAVKDGREFWADLKNEMHETVFFVGSFEEAATRIVRACVDKGSVCIDVGANFGWYTTLLSRLVGDSGSIHAFEPVYPTYCELERNCALLDSRANIVLNNLALGDKPGTISINLFEGLPSGHASISAQGRTDAVVYESPIVTLDSYLADKGIDRVDFVKVDIEGAEMLFLRGAERLFRQDVPPAILMEMALNQSSNFGHTPNDLVEFIRARGDYDFYKIEERKGTLIPIDGFSPDDIGANVFCFPRGRFNERIRGFVER